jgi:hypothetical protein
MEPSSQKMPLEVRTVDARVTVGALRIETEARRTDGAESSMELWNFRVTAEAQLSYALKREEMSVRGAVRRMAGGATFDARDGMLEYERAALVGMAADTGLLLEAAELRATGRLMRVMAGRAVEGSLAQAVALGERKFVELLGVAIEAHRRTRAVVRRQAQRRRHFQ